MGFPLSQSQPHILILSLSVFLWPTWSGIQFNIFRTVVPITTKQELLSMKCSMLTHKYMHTCRPTYIFPGTYAHVQIHMPLVMYINTYMHTVICTHAHPYAHSGMHTCIHIHDPLYTCLFTGINLHIYVHACIYIYTCTKAHIYICSLPPVASTHSQDALSQDNYHSKSGTKTI